MIKIVIAFFIFNVVLFANEADEIIKKLDNNMRGKNISMKLTMKVVSMGYERTMKYSIHLKNLHKKR